MANFPSLLSLFLLFFITSFVPIFQVGSERSVAGQWFPADTAPGVNTCPVAAEKCGSECDRRCSATSHKSNCLMFCNMCCNKCLCVPPATFGNKQCCACYDNWKTKEGGPKCP